MARGAFLDRVPCAVGVLLATVVLCVADPACADEERDAQRFQLRELERLAEELGDLGFHEEAERVLERAEEIEADLARSREPGRLGDEARRALGNRIEIMLAALDVLADSRHHDAHDLLDRAVVADRTLYDGRHDDEGLESRMRRPGPEDIAEALAVAAELYADRDDSRARPVARLARAMAEEAERHRGQRREREEAHRQARLMRQGVDALFDGDRDREGERLEHALHALELALAGRRDGEAHEIRESAPSRAERAELLILAAEILRDRGRAARARELYDLARRFRAQHERIRDAGERREAAAERERRMDAELGQVFKRLDGLEAAVESLQREIEQLREALEERR